MNHGPTILVSARHGGVQNVMAADWACALDFSPPKLTVVLDKAAQTCGPVEQTGTFVLQVPTVAQLTLTHQAGTRSLSRETNSNVASAAEGQEAYVLRKEKESPDWSREFNLERTRMGVEAKMRSGMRSL
ncbi:flavin reductase [Candidimonas sp. SYP-B2681]|nr:flavin reductase [Candidimonas sp. SYP-B2681]